MNLRKSSGWQPHSYGRRTGRAAILVASLIFSACSAESPVPDSKEVPVVSDPVKFIDPPSGPGAMAPNLALSRGGVLLTWLEPNGDGNALYLAELRAEGWTPATQIAAGNAFFANWADLPAATENASGTRFAHWLRKLGVKTYAYGADLARSNDRSTWEPLGLLHDDASPSEHGFVSYVPLPGGNVQAFWLDGRSMPSGGAMQLRTAQIGETGPPGASVLLDDRVCECCATDAALTATGPVVAYRDRGPTEIRDIAIVHSIGEGWTEPTVIHDDGWQIHGCPVNGPAIAADGARVAVAWFTLGGGTPQAQVALAFSDDAGASFTEPILIDDAKPLGRVDVALDHEGRALVSWMGSKESGAEIRWRRAAQDGTTGPMHVVAATTTARSAGVPRMLHRGEDLLFAWVEDAKPSQLRVGLVPPR